MPNQDTDQIQLTQEGLEELQQELQELKTEKLPTTIKRVAVARDHGDLSENAEYHSAREEQQLLETRIDEIEQIIAKAKVVKHTKSSSKIGMGSDVEVSQKNDKRKKMKFTIVGEFQADPSKGEISSVSPLGKALMGRKKGDTVTVQAPSGALTYIIDSIK